MFAYVVEVPLRSYRNALTAIEKSASIELLKKEGNLTCNFGRELRSGVHSEGELLQSSALMDRCDGDNTSHSSEKISVA
jgi:hypothetical protein